MKLQFSKGMRSLLGVSACLLLFFAVIYSCQKNSTSNPLEEEIVNTDPGNRLLSVANVYKADDGKTIEVWFFETPLVHELSIDNSNAKSYLSMLEKAKGKNIPVVVKLSKYSENAIEAVLEPSPEEIASFRKDFEMKQKAEAKMADEAVATKLTGVIPNKTTLNTIFEKIKTQCCKASGPYIYGQCIPFQYVADGCYARAHKMRQVIESYYGYTSYKVFNFACDGRGTLTAKATLWNNNCCVKWWYHVTSYVIVQEGTVQNKYAIDPAMFNAPVSISTWVSAQKNSSCGYGGAAQGQVYYASNAYAPNSLSNCKLVAFTDNSYNSANSTCANYSSKQGCY